MKEYLPLSIVEANNYEIRLTDTVWLKIEGANVLKKIKTISVLIIPCRYCAYNECGKCVKFNISTSSINACSWGREN